ncbi:MAG: hypothetical protein WBM44_12700, partial [Waterburya sp.]
MSNSQSKALDPRLRRIFRTRSDPARLRNDLARGTVTGSMEAIQPEAVFKSVLVALKSDRIPQGFTDYRWINIVERFYSAEIPVSQLEELAATPEVEFVEAGRELVPFLSI